MTCDECGHEMVARKATLEQPYAYTLSGLPVRLAGITVWRCPTCHDELPSIPRIAELHRVIAEALVTKANPLRGTEVRFLRKQAGMLAQRFAALIGVSPEHLSRVENEHMKLGESADRLARAVATAARGEHHEAVVGLADLLLSEWERSKKRAERTPVTFKLQRGDWKAAA